MQVFVKNKNGDPLMPCSQRKARVLLKEQKATIDCYNPFTIKLKYGSSGYSQETTIAVDQGGRYIGVAVVRDNDVLVKAQIELRQDVKENLQYKAMCKQGRNSRKWYREPKWRIIRVNYHRKRLIKAKEYKHGSKRPAGWLPPSVQSKLNHNFKWIDLFCSLVPKPKLVIEVGKFDIQKMKNPDISGKEYQQGQLYNYENTKSYVLTRDNYTCQCCGAKNVKFHIHHIKFRSMGGTDDAGNLITVCTKCHTKEAHQVSGKLYKWMLDNKKVREYKAPTFMNILQKRTIERYPGAQITYGYVTNVDRRNLGLAKTHYNDAIAISGIKQIRNNTNQVLFVRQFRSKNRQLHNLIPSKGSTKKGIFYPNTEQKRDRVNVRATTNKFGLWSKGDCVKLFGKIGWITGFSGSYECCVRDLDYQSIKRPDKPKYDLVNYKMIQSRISKNNNWLFQTKQVE